jgi:O-antigen/teichoic acid export membrane protein
MSAAGSSVMWREDHQARTVALNVTARWVTIVVEMALGFLMLPFNTRHLGAADYGLWMLSASIVSYFPIMNLGYAASIDRFVAQYRARRDASAINEIASTLFVLFATVGLVAMVVVTLIGLNIGTLFNMPPGQERTGQAVLMLVGLQFAVGMPFATFGGVVNGFQRTYLNGIVGASVALAVAVVNVVVLLLDGTLVQLVAAMSATRMLGYIAYRLNAYRVFPLLRIRPMSFSMARLREVTGFSVFMLMQNASNKANYATDPMVIAAFLSTGAVAVWTVAQRLADMILKLTNQLNDVLFPVVVDCDSTQQHDRLRDVLVQGTRLSLALALPVSGVLMLLADQVVVAWAGPIYGESAVILQLLVMVVLVRVGSATAGTVLRGAGHHQLLSISNMVAAVVNIALSLILIWFQGLPGVALATLIPVSIRGATVLIPVACRRVGISVWQFFFRAIWPAAWPAVVTLGVLALVRDRIPVSLLVVAACGALTVLAYFALFAGLAMGSDDRGRYLAKIRGILRHRRAPGRPAVVQLTPAASDQSGGVS